MTTATKTAIRKYCEECLKFRRKKCKGKISFDHIENQIEKYWGTDKKQNKVSGLNFCKLYEFDYRLYHFKDGSGEVATIKHVRKRQAKRDVEVSNQEHSDVVDLAASLSSADFEGLI